jgi:hypothetical protein
VLLLRPRRILADKRENIILHWCCCCSLFASCYATKWIRARMALDMAQFANHFLLASLISRVVSVACAQPNACSKPTRDHTRTDEQHGLLQCIRQERKNGWQRQRPFVTKALLRSRDSIHRQMFYNLYCFRTPTKKEKSNEPFFRGTVHPH